MELLPRPGNDRTEVPARGTFKVRIGGIELEYRDAWDVPGILENFALRVYSQELIRPGSVVLDLGAGIGDFTLIASAQVGDNGTVISVEPNPEDFVVLLRNIRSNGCRNVVPLNLAVSESRASMSLTFKGQTFTAASRPLQEVLRLGGVTAVDFVKMDIEGAESSLVPQSLNLIASARCIAVELHGNQEALRKLLSESGFTYVPADSKRMSARLLLFVARHPLPSIQLCRRIIRLPEYQPSQLVRRLARGFDIAQENRLMVCLFTSSK